MQYVPAVPDNERSLNVATPEIASTEVFPDNVAPEGVAQPSPETKAADTVPVLRADRLSAESRKRTVEVVIVFPEFAVDATVDAPASLTVDNLVAVPAATLTEK